MRRRVLFVRVGWMTFYQGPQHRDRKPIAGGRWNRDNVGHEVYNFLPVGSRCYAHFEPPGKTAFDEKKKVRLERIDPKGGGNELHGVLVVFVAKRPSQSGQVVVGWYRNATVYRTRQFLPGDEREGYGHYSVADRRHVVLLPTRLRTWLISNEDRSFGQSNVCYPLDAKGRTKGLTWQRSLTRKALGYEGENLLDNPAMEVQELALAVSRGQGYGLNALERSAVEAHAMKQAERYFRSSGFQVMDTSRTKPFDLLCRRKGRVLYVEVKGTTGDGGSVFLTGNEVRHAFAHPQDTALFVVSGVRLEQTQDGPVASGGKQLPVVPWTPDEKRLKALHYQYDLTGER